MAAEAQPKEASNMASETSGGEEGERICRYCFEGEEVGELISPCKCSGGQAFVHLACLRRWQRGILTGQPTHPDFYDADSRHKVCGVCKTEFQCKPPTRLELMQHYTGDEVAGTVKEGGLICSHRGFSRQLESQIALLPAALRAHHHDRHWINGVFLIARVTPDSGATLKLRITDQAGLNAFAESISEAFTVQARGRQYRLLFQGQLAHAQDLDDAGRRVALRSLRVPSFLMLTSTDEGDVGEDGISGVNLTRPLPAPDLMAAGLGPALMSKAMQYRKALAKVLVPGESLLPQVHHFVGGPCHSNKVEFAIVTAAPEEYVVKQGLAPALQLAQQLCKGRAALEGAEAAAAWKDSSEGNVHSNTVEAEQPPAKRRRGIDGVATLQSAADAEAGAAGGSSSSTAPAPRDVTDHEEGNAKEDPASDFQRLLTKGSVGDVRVLVYWGTAEWSRCQLMGEIAQGSWGVCRAEMRDVTSIPHDRIYEAVHSRLAFAPRTEMTETFDVEDEVTTIRRRIRRAQAQGRAQDRPAGEDETLLAELAAREAMLPALPSSSSDDGETDSEGSESEAMDSDDEGEEDEECDEDMIEVESTGSSGSSHVRRMREEFMEAYPELQALERAADDGEVISAHSGNRHNRVEPQAQNHTQETAGAAQAGDRGPPRPNEGRGRFLGVQCAIQ